MALRTVFVVTKDVDGKDGDTIPRFIGVFKTIDAAAAFVDHPIRFDPDNLPDGSPYSGDRPYYYQGPYNVEEWPVWEDNDLGINGWPQTRVR